MESLDLKNPNLPGTFKFSDALEQHKSFIDQLITDLYYLVKNFGTGDNWVIFEKFKDKYHLIKLFNPFATECEEFVEKMKSSQSVGILVEELSNMEKIKYAIHLFMKMNDNLGFRVTMRFDENNRLVGAASAQHYNPQELEGNQQQLL